MTSPIEDFFSQFQGEPIPGGCDMCTAYQSIEEVVPGVHSLTIAHDPECAILRASRARTN
jgi:hypothetical protein